MTGNRKISYQICTKCIMDTSDPDITFNESGVCNHCVELQSLYKSIEYSDKQVKTNLKDVAAEIKRNSKNRQYDCIIGLSGGVDSSYVGYLAHSMELRVLAVHFDNGWNSELAVQNIKNIVDILNIDLMTYVINWEEFRDLQRAFLKASVVDIEMLTDHAIIASLFKIARERKIKYILSGTNIATESGMPKSWVWNKRDKRNIKAIHKRFGEKRLKTFPMLGRWKWLLNQKLGYGPVFFELLNKEKYNKTETKKLLQERLKWRDYGGKHYESVFTKFYQAYILPVKFKIDKRRAHLSSLIRNKELTRNEALEEIQKPLYSEKELKTEKEYVLKKLGFTNKEFVEIMNLNPSPHNTYPTSETIERYLIQVRNAFSKKFVR
jgi:N-acetyl sugar amidotransferase